MASTDIDIPVLSFASQIEWEAWLNEHHADGVGLWLKIAKKNSGITTVTYVEAVESALCYGWIDSQLKPLDVTYYLQKFTPRRSSSVWSKVNRNKATALIAAGRMQSPGMAAIEAAKQDGRWDRAYDSSSTMEVPPDFQAALNACPRAAEFFKTIDRANRFAFLWRIQTAASKQTRQARIKKFIAMLEAGQTIHSK